MSLYEQELQELRASDSHYVGLVAQQRLQLDRLENQKKTIMEDNACLNAKLNGRFSCFLIYSEFGQRIACKLFWVCFHF